MRVLRNMCGHAGGMYLPTCAVLRNCGTITYELVRTRANMHDIVGGTRAKPCPTCNLCLAPMFLRSSCPELDRACGGAMLSRKLGLKRCFMPQYSLSFQIFACDACFTHAVRALVISQIYASATKPRNYYIILIRETLYINLAPQQAPLHGEGWPACRAHAWCE